MAEINPQLIGLTSFKNNWLCKHFNTRREKTMFVTTGNQYGKTYMTAHSIVLRIIGQHPVPEKNMTPDNPIRILRFASETLPNDTTGGESKNTQYPAFKKVLPPGLIKRDISIRRPTMTIKDEQGGPDIYVEFVSYSQTVNSQAGVQRFLVWADEKMSQDFYQEQIPRLIASNGEFIYTLTPAESYLGWEFDELYEKARVYIRTQRVVDRFKSRFNQTIKKIEENNSTEDIAVFQAATDDNPFYEDLVATINRKHANRKGFVPYTQDTYLSERFSKYSDDDDIDVRRYGIFRQVSGLVFKPFDLKTHVISKIKYFSTGIPANWIHARGIDYHERVPWAIGLMALSPQNEAFIYGEFNPSPENFTTRVVCEILSDMCGAYKYKINLVDPNAAKIQTNTGRTTLQDINTVFSELYRQGKGSGGYWQTWDTKSTSGRDQIKERMENSRKCGVPFNNRSLRYGSEYYLPTIWVLDSCPLTIQSFKHWRWEESSSRYILSGNEEKNKPQEQWSHFPMVYEAIFKNPMFQINRFQDRLRVHESPYLQYYHARP